MQRAKDAVAEIDAAGVQVKDLDIGLLDFPCIVGEEVILLCWKLGENRHYALARHREGFAGRKPMMSAFCGSQKEEAIRRSRL